MVETMHISGNVIGKENPAFFETLAMVSENTPVGLYAVQENILIYVNKWLADILGYETVTSLLGKPFSDLFYSDDGKKVLTESMGKELPDGSVPSNVRLIKADGSFIWMSMRENAVTLKGKPAIIGRFVEITPMIEMMDLQSRINSIFGRVKDSVIMVDADQKVISTNSSTRTICGFKARDIIGRSLCDYPASCSKACCDVLATIIETKLPVKDIPVECNAPFRPQQVVSVNSSPFLDPEGNFMGAVLVAKDLTLLKNIERDLEERHHFQNIIGKNKQMQDIYKLLEDLANLETTVLVTGESGTGKELIAKALHYSGKRSVKPFITVNCSALAENLLESELFGHIKGAFTGAVTDKQGRFDAADGGTLLLDEIGDISPLIQLKLLRVLQEKEFERVGESAPRRVDVRVIACTNKDLKGKVKTGKFREDLYYRLKVVEIPLPPLRDRLEDVPLLVNHSCNQFNKIFNKSIAGISSDVLTRFMEYPWPGNIRELKHAIECAFVLCHEKIITIKHLPPEIRNFKHQTKPDAAHSHHKKTSSAEEIIAVLNKTYWNKASAARILGISRQTLYRKLNEYGIIKKV